jgi:hypothetical protein
MKRLETLFYSFIWDGKPDRIKRKTLIGDIEKGGLKMFDIEIVDACAKLFWVRKLTRETLQGLPPLAHWLHLAQLSLDTQYLEVFWKFGNKWLQKHSGGLNNEYWKDTIKAWILLKEALTKEKDAFSEFLWYNDAIKVGSRPVFLSEMV